jgi:hypothetical protein
MLNWLLSEDAWIRLCTNPTFIVAALMICIGMPVALLRPSRKARQAAGRLARLEDVSAIGGLVETLAFGHDSTGHAPAREALIRLLPQLKASDRDVLTEGQIALLRATLGTSPYVTGNLFSGLSRRLDAHTRLQIAILKAFEQVGDSHSLPVISRLAKHASNPQVRAAAEECLPFVRARVDQARVSQTLLRAADASGTAPDTLLRPAHGGHATVPAELVRPGTGPDAEHEVSRT